MSEFEYIKKLKELFEKKKTQELINGIGDDCCVLNFKKDKKVVITTDTMVQGVHFRSEFSTPYQLGYRLGTINISDIYSVGASPTYGLYSVVMPQGTDLIGISKGLAACARDFSFSIIGGNISAGQELSISLTLLGELKDKQRLRSDLKIADDLWTTGEIGLGFYGLKQLIENKVSNKRAVQWYLKPKIDYLKYEKLNKLKDIRGCIDISDGLIQDLSHLLIASNCGAEIEVDKIKTPKEISKYDALSGGDDYQLLFGASPKIEKSLINLGCIKIGRVIKGKKLNLIGVDKDKFPKTGYQHKI